MITIMWKQWYHWVQKHFLSVCRTDLHGDGIFNKHRSQLSVQLKEDLPLTGLVQVAQCQRLYVEGLPSLQLDLKTAKTREDEAEMRTGEELPAQVMETLNNLVQTNRQTRIWTPWNHSRIVWVSCDQLFRKRWIWPGDSFGSSSRSIFSYITCLITWNLPDRQTDRGNH